MHYKYTVYQTTGPNGTTVGHRQQDGVDVVQLGEIDGVTYIHSDVSLDLTLQPEQITLELITLNYAEITALKQQRALSNMKEFVRSDIRKQKSLEDDFVDTKQVIQWLAYAIVDIYGVLTDEQRLLMSYGDNIALFAQMLAQPDNLLRVDVEPDALAKISGVFADEVKFASMVKDRYLDKMWVYTVVI